MTRGPNKTGMVGRTLFGRVGASFSRTWARLLRRRRLRRRRPGRLSTSPLGGHIERNGCGDGDDVRAR